MNKSILPQEKIMELLNVCYDKALNGIPGTPTCYDLANEYMTKYPSSQQAVKEFVKWQIAKCTTSGFLTSLGGIITLPVSVPANLASVWYVQLRMIATIAIMGGFDPADDEVQTLVYICLTGSSVSKMCREAGVQFGNKITTAMIKKIPGTVLTKINQAVHFRFVTKFGTKGLINLGKMVPVVGGIVGGGFDLAGTKVIAGIATKTFIYGEIE